MADGAAWDWQQPSVLLVEDDPGDALLVEELVADGAPGMRLTWVRSISEAAKELASGLIGTPTPADDAMVVCLDWQGAATECA
ncbi:hypothetical protein [Streptomyces sp. H34-S4]|uniref:hypothetical protein n=1 Tax=Streptomyces sp. H34-S4 TaxID=2996463 RepID=UPI003B635139